jgi:hypothetical protein
MISKIPVLKCFPTGKGQVKAWCPFCEKWHIHGYDKKITRAENIGHWVAHCHDKSSPFKNGYYLKLMTKKELADIAASRELYG